MTATEELRRMLDERGVKWMPVAWSPKRETFYRAANGVGFCADEYTNGVKIYTDSTITPEQAIAATFGSCNCSNSERTDGACKADKLCDGYLYYTSYWCRGCDERFAYRPIGGKDRGTFPKFCPNCGRRIVDPTTNDVDAEVEQ